MDKVIAKDWANKLRSGKYPQTMYRLRDDKGLCCLGVLCDLHAIAHPEFAAKQESPLQYGGSSHTLPEIVLEWAKMKSNYGAYSPSSYYPTSLAKHNDMGMPFEEIADIIEKVWKKL